MYKILSDPVHITLEILLYAFGHTFMPDPGKQFLDQFFRGQGVPHHSLYVHVKYWTIVPIEGSKRLLVPIPELKDEQGFIMQFFNRQLLQSGLSGIKLGE